jgi:hypothetical protein
MGARGKGGLGGNVLIAEPNAKKQMREEKEIKVRIPLDYHIRLHAVKVVRGQPISDTVRLALDHYFSGLRADQALPELPSPFEVPPIEPPEPNAP